MAEQAKTAPGSRKVPPMVRNHETERMEQLAEEAHAELPPPGDARREVLKQRDADLQAQIERVGQSIVLNNIDPKYLQIIREIQQRTSYLNVSNRKPGYVYAWVTKNNWNNHRTRLEAVGYEVVQGDDPEALELKGTSGIAAGTGTPDTTRQLGDVILMRIKEEYYIAQKAREHARTLAMQVASASTLITMARPYFNRGIRVGTQVQGMGDQLQGPRIRPRSFSSRRAQMLGLLDNQVFQEQVREGTIPGMEMQP